MWRPWPPSTTTQHHKQDRTSCQDIGRPYGRRQCPMPSLCLIASRASSSPIIGSPWSGSIPIPAVTAVTASHRGNHEPAEQPSLELQPTPLGGRNPEAPCRPLPVRSDARGSDRPTRRTAPDTPLREHTEHPALSAVGPLIGPQGWCNGEAASPPPSSTNLKMKSHPVFSLVAESLGNPGLFVFTQPCSFLYSLSWKDFY